LRIVNDILDFAKIEARKLDLEHLPFALSDCLDQLIKLTSIQCEAKGLELQVDLQPDVPDLLIGDAGRLRQVLLNLLNNAVKFTSKGSIALAIRAGRVSDSHVFLLFAVTDTGIGIPNEKQKLIFEAFSQADNSSTRQFGGTGLGLTISSQLIDLMNGSIWVDSELEHGSTFSF